MERFLKKPVPTLMLVLLVATCLAGITLGALSLRHAFFPSRSDQSLTTDQTTMVQAALTLMQSRGLTEDAAFGTNLLNQGIWRAASSTDTYIAQAERAGDTPYAYTLAEGKHIFAVVLAPRFFTETTPTGRAAVMIHEMGHVRAYQATGHSTEYDGYKREYDTHKQLGLTDADGLVYWSMLDGVVENVVPRDPSYKHKPDVKDYIAQSN
jgi:hypothetical protein